MTRTSIGCVLALALAVGCGGGSEPSEEPATDTAGSEEPAEDPAPSGDTLSAEECEARGGTVVGDIGDGATHRPDYLCPNGQSPIATVPLGIEGSVCCGA